MKIAVIGYSGSGKSTLARILGEKYKLPVLHLDAVTHLPGWVRRSDEEASDDVRRFMAENNGWVIDGNYRKCCHEERLRTADKIIFLDYNRFFCFFSAWRRAVKYKNTVRPDMAAGCNEKFDLEFALWILRDGRKKAAKVRYDEYEKQYPEKFIRIKNRRRLNRLLKGDML
ncbi:MAG: topology modulation protein [Clostridiales bacterium]|nr:topology modulation protein [Clostridiales bacterium]